MRFIIVLFSLITAPIFGQNFTITPNDTIEANVSTDNLHVANINQIHLGTATLRLSWRQVYVNVPIDWEASMCDFGHCYTDLPLNGSMDSLVAGDNGLMSLHITPHITNGTAIIQYEIWDEDFPNNKSLLTWIMKNSSTSIAEQELENPLFYFAQDRVWIDNPFSVSTTFTISNLMGQEIIHQNIELGKSSQNISFLANGMYILNLSNGVKSRSKKVWKAN